MIKQTDEQAIKEVLKEIEERVENIRNTSHLLYYKDKIIGMLNNCWERINYELVQQHKSNREWVINELDYVGYKIDSDNYSVIDEAETLRYHFNDLYFHVANFLEIDISSKIEIVEVETQEEKVDVKEPRHIFDVLFDMNKEELMYALRKICEQDSYYKVFEFLGTEEFERSTVTKTIENDVKLKVIIDDGCDNITIKKDAIRFIPEIGAIIKWNFDKITLPL